MPTRLVGTGGDGDSHGSCFPARRRFPFQSSDDPFQQIVTARSDQGQARASRVLLTRQERIELGQKRIQEDVSRCSATYTGCGDWPRLEAS